MMMMMIMIVLNVAEYTSSMKVLLSILNNKIFMHFFILNILNIKVLMHFCVRLKGECLIFGLPVQNIGL